MWRQLATLSVSPLSWTRRKNKRAGEKQREREREKGMNTREHAAGIRGNFVECREDRRTERRTRCANPRKCDREWNFCCKLDTLAFIEVLTSKEIATRDVCSGCTFFAGRYFVPSEIFSFIFSWGEGNFITVSEFTYCRGEIRLAFLVFRILYARRWILFHFFALLFFSFCSSLFLFFFHFFFFFF